MARLGRRTRSSHYSQLLGVWEFGVGRWGVGRLDTHHGWTNGTRKASTRHDKQLTIGLPLSFFNAISLDSPTSLNNAIQSSHNHTPAGHEVEEEQLAFSGCLAWANDAPAIILAVARSNLHHQRLNQIDLHSSKSIRQAQIQSQQRFSGYSPSRQDRGSPSHKRQDVQKRNLHCLPYDTPCCPIFRTLRLRT